jgi:glycosyltransferase involved in cell wall biosynthesis
MKLVVIIPTLGRGNVLGKLLQHLQRQVRRPDLVIVSAPDESHVELADGYPFPVELAFGPKGLPAQRNTALRRIDSRFDVVTFFDDDFIPADDYLQRVERAFTLHPDWSVVSGWVVRDGAGTAGLTWDEGIAALETAAELEPNSPDVIDHVGAYGCNMSIRVSHVGRVRFDERLVLYGWQEDIDFTSQLRRRGRVVGVHRIRGVHLGVKSGRTSGLRLGYSQVANPVYLVRKGTVPASFLLPLMARNVIANAVRSLWPEPWVDRRGRLKGNIIAFFHLMTGRIEPEYILRL